MPDISLVPLHVAGNVGHLASIVEEGTRDAVARIRVPGRSHLRGRLIARLRLVSLKYQQGLQTWKRDKGEGSRHTGTIIEGGRVPSGCSSLEAAFVREDI